MLDKPGQVDACQLKQVAGGGSQAAVELVHPLAVRLDLVEGRIPLQLVLELPKGPAQLTGEGSAAGGSSGHSAQRGPGAGQPGWVWQAQPRPWGWGRAGRLRNRRW